MFPKETGDLPGPQDALPGRDEPIATPERHYVLDTPMQPPFPADTREAVFGLGCFWGAEQLFWETEGVYTTAAGYAGGYTPNPTYDEVCSGRTGHAEVVRVVYRPDAIDYESLLRIFWESHDPTQGMKQGADVGTQYRSVILTFGDEQQRLAEQSRETYRDRLQAAGYDGITTEIGPAGDFFYAEDYHQQYLAKNPGGYCGIGGTGVSCPIRSA